MIVGFTGHRSVINPEKVKERLVQALKELNPTKTISGMAIGFDTLAAKTCIELDIPFLAAVPFKGQESIWPAFVQEEYHRLLEFAQEIVIVSEGDYAAWKMQYRNRYIVDNSDVIVTYFNGNRGGTFSCHKYAEEQDKKIINIYQ